MIGFTGLSLTLMEATSHILPISLVPHLKISAVLAQPESHLCQTPAD